MTLSTWSMVRPACISFMAFPALCIATSVSLLMLAVSMEKISLSSVMICELVCSRECSNCFFRRNADFAATIGVSDYTRKPIRAELPCLLEETCFRASASCSSIWFCRCLSLLFSISS
jgi:hypothetical protein